VKGEKMEEAKRPGMLTVLAVINFILAFLYILLNGLAILSFAFIDYMPLEYLNETQIAQMDAMRQLSTGELVFMFGPPMIAGIILLLAGIGYLKQKKILGWVMGNAYAAVMILHTIISPFVLPRAFKGGTVSIIIALAYPIITLILINFVYKKNLVN
jgi:hypothetical protein